MAERKSSLLKKSKQGFLQQSQQQNSIFKNQNVIFKIHTPRGQENYNSKNFPAKFSINICNQAIENSPQFIKRDNTSPSLSSQIYGNLNNPDLPSFRSQKSSPAFDFQKYQRQLKGVLDDKKKHDKLIKQLENTCIEYQRKNLELTNSLDELHIKIKKLSERLGAKQQSEMQALHLLSKTKAQNRELQMKLAILEANLKKQAQQNLEMQRQLKQQVKNLENKISSLQFLIIEKQQIIKNISNFNNEIAKSMIEGQSVYSSSHVKQIEKWCKALSRKNENVNSENFSLEKQNKSNKDSEEQISLNQLIYKYERAGIKILELQKQNQYLSLDLKRSEKQNQHLTKSNMELTKMISELEQTIEHKQMERETQESFFKRTMTNRSENFEDKGMIIYEGTVKVKMESLLIEKDKRISSLECQLMDAKKQNTILRTKIYQLEFRESYDKQDELKKARSLSNFFTKKDEKCLKMSQCRSPRQKEGTYLYKDLLSQCNNLTETLGSFMETCKTERIPSLYCDNPSEKVVEASRVKERGGYKHSRHPSSGEWERGNKQNRRLYQRQNSLVIGEEVPRFEYIERD